MRAFKIYPRIAGHLWEDNITVLVSVFKLMNPDYQDITQYLNYDVRGQFIWVSIPEDQPVPASCPAFLIFATRRGHDYVCSTHQKYLNLPE